MSLAELIQSTPTRAWNGVRSKKFRWSSESLTDKIKNGWSDLKYSSNRKLDRVTALGKKAKIDKLAKYTGLSNLWHFYVEGVGIPGFGGVGSLPASFQNVYERKYKRPHGAPTRNSVIAGLLDTALWLYGASLLGGLGVAGKVAGTGIAAYKWVGLGELMFRGAYNLTTGNNIGLTLPRLALEAGKFSKKVFSKGSQNVIPLYTQQPNTYQTAGQRKMNYYMGTRSLRKVV